MGKITTWSCFDKHIFGAASTKWPPRPRPRGSREDRARNHSPEGFPPSGCGHFARNKSCPSPWLQQSLWARGLTWPPWGEAAPGSWGARPWPGWTLGKGKSVRWKNKADEVGAGSRPLGARVCKALGLVSALRLSGDRGGTGARLPRRGRLRQRRGWRRLQPPNHKGPSAGSWHLGSSHNASEPRRGCAVGGTSVAGPGGPRGEDEKRLWDHRLSLWWGRALFLSPASLLIPPRGAGGEGSSRAAQSLRCALPFRSHLPLVPCLPLVDGLASQSFFLSLLGPAPGSCSPGLCV